MAAPTKAAAPAVQPTERHAAALPTSPPVVIANTPTRSGGDTAATLVDARPAALVNGQSITWGELRPILNEAAGAEALQEVILDQKIAKALNDSHIVISDDDIAAERKTLLESLSGDPNVAMRLLDELRNRQHLGKARFTALMKRNAGLRALVHDQVKINDAAVQTLYEMVHGAKRQARLMVLPDLAAAEGAINLVKSGASFADVAVELSTDSSAPRGGLLEPISVADPAYPESLRQTLFSLSVGEMSGPILLDNKYAVVMLVKRIAPDQVKLEDIRTALQSQVRSNQERILMDHLARRMLADASVTVFDDSLNESWSRRNKSP